MLAARDQENLVHGHHTAAAAKPLNQGSKQLAPKTPGNKVPKTPFKVPLNDENAPIGFGGGKTGLKTNIKGNENFIFGSKKGGAVDKNAFVTPLGPRARAPLGLKTTNAKAKAFQTPAPQGGDNGLDKTKQGSASARKPKPRVSHAETTKLEVLGDKEDAEEREIEYMPPRSIPLPDYPEEDLFGPDKQYPMFEGANLTRGWYETYCNPVDEEGISRSERREIELDSAHEKKVDAMLAKSIEEMPIIGYNVPEFPGDETIVGRMKKQEAEEQRKKKAVAIAARPNTTNKKPLASKGPSGTVSRNAAAALSQPKPSGAALKPKDTNTKAKLPSSLIKGNKKTPQPVNPSPMRHTAATAASRTTLGYSHGRATSSSLKRGTLPRQGLNKNASSGSSENTVRPALFAQKKGNPELGTEEWRRMKVYGLFDDDEENVEDALKGGSANLLAWDDELDQEFQLPL
ncbi:MAG: hypothetical protein M1812_004660 [Candelaria pacifica]|nr:MAG: hypothetical protein M1812_004660 [Candelaria pacifica]